MENSVTMHGPGTMPIPDCYQGLACGHLHTVVPEEPYLYAVLSMTGPGFTGPYTWSSGVLALRPDPYAAFGMTPASPSGRRLVSMATSPAAHSDPAAEQESAHKAASQQCSVGMEPGSCEGPRAGRTLLQTTATPIGSSGGASIQGQVEAREIGASSASRTMDGLRGDGRAWVDKLGAVAVIGQVRTGGIAPKCLCQCVRPFVLAAWMHTNAVSGSSD